jgi:hypothetical protein
MSFLDNYALYFTVIMILLISIVLFYNNFVQIYNFSWFYNYYYTKDKICNVSNGSKLEVETLHYNIFRFLYGMNQDNEKYQYIKDSFKMTFWPFITFYSILLLSWLVYIIWINGDFIKSLVSQSSSIGQTMSGGSIHSKSYSGMDGIYVLFIAFLVVYIVYTSINSYIIMNFNEIDGKLHDEENIILKYGRVYTILNAMITMSNLDDTKMLYKRDDFNKVPRTFKEIIEGNIASYENISNTSKIQQIKGTAVENLDIAKYLVMDKYSSFFLVYFDNIYIKTSFSDYQVEFIDLSKNVFLNDLFSFDNSNVSYSEIYGNVKRQFDYIVEDIRQNHNASTNSTYIEIEKYITTEFPLEQLDIEKLYKSLLDFYKKIENIIDENDKTLRAHSLEFVMQIQTRLNNVESLLRHKQTSEMYTKINQKIGDVIKNSKGFKVSFDNDFEYVKYFMENKDVLIQSNEIIEKQFDLDISSKLKNQSDFLYSYMLLWMIILFIFSHYLFITQNSINYFYIMFIAICIYITIFYYRSTSNSIHK